MSAATPAAAAVLDDQVDDRPAVLYPPAPARPHWLVDALRTAPRALIFGTGFALGLVLVTSDTIGAALLDHIGFRLVGL